MITHLIFDLDNTLYSARYGLEDRVSQRINAFLGKLLALSPEEAEAIRKGGPVKKYGTTLEWLMAEQGFTDVEAYYKAVCPENEADALPPDPLLGDFLASLPQPKAILTNSAQEHVDHILARLGIGPCIDYIFDMRFNKFQGKPRPGVFLRALDRMGAQPETTLFVDDNPRFVEGFLALGGKALFLDEFDRHADSSLQRIKHVRDIKAFLD